MKNITIFLLLSLATFVQAEVLVTPSVKANIIQACEEGEVTCSKVKLELIESSTESTIYANGKTLHSTCSDGNSPCAFQGWEFYNKKGVAFIFITPSGTVTMQDAEGGIALEESGEWQ